LSNSRRRSIVADREKLADELDRLFTAAHEAHEAYDASRGDRNAATAADEAWTLLTRALVRSRRDILTALRADSPAAVERAAVAARDAAATRAEGRGFWLAVARAALRAALEPPR
jgi:hypothetical protein